MNLCYHTILDSFTKSVKSKSRHKLLEISGQAHGVSRSLCLCTLDTVARPPVNMNRNFVGAGVTFKHHPNPSESICTVSESPTVFGGGILISL